MQLALGLTLGPLRLSLTVGEGEDEADEDEDDMPADVVGELIRLGADTTVFGFTPDPAFRDQTGWEEEE